MNNIVVLSLDIKEREYQFDSSIKEALEHSKLELIELQETIESINELKPACDKLDYALAAGSGALCGIIDIFLVGKPGESPIGELTDKWFANRTQDFARLCGWKGEKENLSSALRYLEKVFKVPYDQNGIGDIARQFLDLTPSNHHFKSLGHNPTLMGLFFSVLDQFSNNSHFVSDGDFIVMTNSGEEFYLQGKDIPSKIFCGIANWFGHLVSDVSGSSGSKTRGMGIPSPIWSWSNDIIALKRKLGLDLSKFDKSFNELALNIYKEGYDFRFQAAQMIPVFINELVVRLLYSFRRLLSYFKENSRSEWSFKELWKACEPFSNPTIKRMLTVAHGTFCLIDITDATIRGFAAGAGVFNPTEFFLRLNIVGIGRFSISLYGEAQRGIQYHVVKEDVLFAKKEKVIVDDYISSLQKLAEIYEDENLINFVDDLRKSDAYIKGFEKTIKLAEHRNVPEEKILKSKAEIDAFFNN